MYALHRDKYVFRMMMTTIVLVWQRRVIVLDKYPLCTEYAEVKRLPLDHSIEIVCLLNRTLNLIIKLLLGYKMLFYDRKPIHDSYSRDKIGLYFKVDAC